MAEIREFTKAPIKINKVKGYYTGDALTGLISPVPEGFGEFTTADNKITLKGQFKNGSFVNGKAETKFVTCWGSFDNFVWLGGNKARLDFNNSQKSFIEGSVNPKTKEFEISKMVIVDKVFGDKYEVGHIRSGDVDLVLFGNQDFTNNSNIYGDFVCDGINRDLLTQNGELPKLTCVKGKCKLKIQDSKEQKAVISGNYARDEKSWQVTIDGVYSLENESEFLTLESEGIFDFVRKEKEFADDNISEQFGALRVKNELGSHIDLVLRAGGKIKFKTLGGIFEGVKSEPQIEQGQTVQTYVGKMSKHSNTFTANGTFDSDLTFQKGVINLKTGAETCKFWLDDMKVDKSQNGVMNYSGTVYGSYKTKDMHLQGAFNSGFVFSVDEYNVIKTAVLDDGLTHISGKVRHHTADGAYFEGKLLSQSQREMSLLAPSFVRDDFSIKKIYHGEYSLLDNLGEYIFDQKGYFSDGYHHEYGSSFMKNALGTGKTFNGKYSRQSGYDGYLKNPKNDDFQKGYFDTNLKFISGEFRQTYSNDAVFEGTSLDLRNASGTLSRKGDFMQKGSFKLDSDLYPELVRGDLLVHFDDDGHTYCEGKFDKDGIKLTNLNGEALFGDSTYLLNFKNENFEGSEVVAGKNLTDIYTRYLAILRACGSEKVKTAVDTPKVAEVCEKTEENTSKQEENTQTSEVAGKSGAVHFTDAVEIAGEIVDTTTAGDKPFDKSLAESVMSRLKNPNKESSQDKE